MKIYVLLKQVPDLETKIKLKSDKSGIEEADIKWVINPYDEFAIEEAIKTKESSPESVCVALSLGPKKRTSDALRTALAMGCDEAIVIDTDETLDSWTTAQAVAKVIAQEGPYRVVFSGRTAIDDTMSAVSQMVAEELQIPHATVVSRCVLTNEKAEVEREVEGGTREKIELQLPCVIACNKGLNTPRYASLPGIMKAKKKPLREIGFQSLGLQGGIKVRYKNFELPPDKAPAKILTGEPDQIASQLVQLLRDEAKVI